MSQSAQERSESVALFDALRSPAWRAALAGVIDSEESLSLSAFVAEERAAHEVLPATENVFAAYDAVAPGDVRVVILGQDPYPTPGHAHGLAFSYQGDGSLPRSLRNVFKELESDLGVEMPVDRGDLTPWAKQGVFLLNTVLTVRAGAAGSHRRRGWEAFTRATLAVLTERNEPIVFVLWGGDARKYARMVPAPHHVLEAGHPSPLSIRHFKGCRHFSRANALLGQRAVDWRL